MQKKFITNLGLLLFLNLLIKPFWILGIDRAVQNAVEANSYGLYYAIFNFSFLFNIILDCGITNFNNKNIAQNNHLVTKHLSHIITLRIWLAAIYLLATIVVSFIIGYPHYHIFLLFFLGINQFLASFILYLRSNLSGLHLFKTDSIISVLDRLIMIAICGALLWVRDPNSPFKIEWYIYAQTVAYVITLLITIIIVIERTRLKKLKMKKVFSIMIIRKSLPYAILVLLMTFYNRIDSVMLERMLPNGAEQAAVYASAYRLLDAGNMIAFLFAGLLLPIFAKMIKQKENLENMVQLSFSIIMLIAITTAVIGNFFSLELMTLLYKKHIAQSALVFQPLITCFIFVSSTYIFGTLLTANGNMKQLNIMASFGMLFNLLLNLVLIPKFEAYGSALSSVVTQGTTALIQIYLSYKIFNFKLNLPYIFKFVVYILLFCFSVKALVEYSNFFWFYNLIIAAILSPTIALLTGFANPFKIYKTVRTEI
jgi:O-antigen/teichoic acid export membrane protein